MGLVSTKLVSGILYCRTLIITQPSNKTLSLSIIKEEELSDQEENFINSQSFDPLASSKISNEIEIGGFPESVSITDIKDIKLQEEY